MGFMARLAALVPTRIDAKSKLAQSRSPAERAKAIEGLRRRDAPGDRATIEANVAAKPGG